MTENKKNAFKKLDAQEVPKNLKKKVMTSISIVEMLSELTELYTVNMASTAIKMAMVETQGQKGNNVVGEKKHKSSDRDKDS